MPYLIVGIICICVGVVLGAAWQGLCVKNKEMDKTIDKHYGKRIREIQEAGRVSEKGKSKDRGET